MSTVTISNFNNEMPFFELLPVVDGFIKGGSIDDRLYEIELFNYDLLERAYNLKAIKIILIKNDEEVVGACIGQININLFNEDDVYFNVYSIYIGKMFRGGKTLLRALKLIGKELKNTPFGVKDFVFCFKAGKKTFGKVCDVLTRVRI